MFKKILKIYIPTFLLAVMVLGIAGIVKKTPTAEARFANGYSFRRTITIDHTKVPNTDQTNFPMLFSGTYQELRQSTVGGKVTDLYGQDIIFTSDSAGTSILSFDQESYNGTTGQVEYWIKIPTLSHTTDTVIYIFYGNKYLTTTSENASGVWDSNYKGVWHMASDPFLTGDDSTSNGNVVGLSCTQTTGEVDGGATCDGSTQYGARSLVSNATDNVTATAWINLANIYGTQEIYQNGSNNANGYSLRILNGLPRLDIAFVSGVSGATSIATSTWAYVGVTRNSGTWQLYLNGTTTGATISNTPNGPGTNTTIAASRTSGGVVSLYLNGKIDEVRFSTAARSSDWIATEYNNQNSPSSFYSLDMPTGSDTRGITIQAKLTIKNAKMTVKPNAAETWPLLQGVDFMKVSKDNICTQSSSSTMESLVRRAQQLGATSISISGFYDNPGCADDTAYIKKWAGFIHAHGLKVWWRMKDLSFEGNYSTTKETTPDGNRHRTTMTNWLTTNAVSVGMQSGDWFTPFSEVQNGGISGTTFCALSVCQWTNVGDFNSWLRGMHGDATTTLASVGLYPGVDVGHYGFDGFVAAGINNSFWQGQTQLEASTLAMMGEITIDHYPEILSPTPHTLAQDYPTMVQALGSTIPIYIGEYGSILSGNDAEGVRRIEQFFREARAIPQIKGISYWPMFGADDESLVESTYPFNPTPQFYVVQKYFKNQ